MSFKNPCCRSAITAADASHDPETGIELDCTTCHNSFMYDGLTWKNKLELGQRKIDKLRTISKTNRLAGGLFGSSSGKTSTDAGTR